jgi:hypothetical protein
MFVVNYYFLDISIISYFYLFYRCAVTFQVLKRKNAAPADAGTAFHEAMAGAALTSR